MSNNEEDNEPGETITTVVEAEPVVSTVLVEGSAIATTITKVVPGDPAIETIVQSGEPEIVVFTSIVTAAGENQDPVVIVVESTRVLNDATSAGAASTSIFSSPSETSSSSGGISDGAKTGIAVVIPVVAVSVMVIGAILFWRSRKRRKMEEENRRVEVEEYSFNPNQNPTLPITSDNSGYRGWGNNVNATQLTSGGGGMVGDQIVDARGNVGGYRSPDSTMHGASSDGHSVDPFISRRHESEIIGELGSGPIANQNRSDIHRGPSNASSSYSQAQKSEGSTDVAATYSNPQEYYDDNYYQHNQYGGGEPVIHEVRARRNMKIEAPATLLPQGNSGIAQNF